MSPRQSIAHNNNTQRGRLMSRDIIPASTDNVVYCLTCTKCPSTLYIGETGRRLADRFREHRRVVINGRNDLPVPALFNQANHTLEDLKLVNWKAHLANEDTGRSRRCGWFLNMELQLLVLVALIRTLVLRELLVLHLLARWHVFSSVLSELRHDILSTENISSCCV